MRARFMITLICVFFLSCTAIAIAQQPIINHNVHVLHNVTASQCPSMWKGQGGDVNTQDYSGIGELYGTTSAVQSCTGCAFDSVSRDCVCQACYVNAI